jgi:hypothetical protein
MKSTIAAKHATAKRILICPQTIFLLYEILGVGCVEQIAARLMGAADCQQHRDFGQWSLPYNGGRVLNASATAKARAQGAGARL